MPTIASRALFAALVLPSLVYALGPHQVAILVRADSQDGLRIANRYRYMRGVPFENVIYLDYRGPAERASRQDFLDGVYRPTLAALKARGLDGRIHVWITTPGLPYRVANNGVSGAIHFGDVQTPKKDPALGPAGYEQTNRYAGMLLGIDAFNKLPGMPHRPLHMHLWAGDVESTLAMIDRSAKADGRTPKGAFYLCDGVGPRGVRKDGIPRAARFLELLGERVEHVEGGEFRGQSDVLGLLTGVVNFPVTANRYAPGALADHLTSLGGVLDEPSGQMCCMEFLRGGASASYGTVVEPFNYPTKFPAPMAHAAYATGLTAVESYWLSLVWPQDGVFVGDPLTRPFAKPPAVSAAAPRPFDKVADKLALDLTMQSADRLSGVGLLELWIDGRPVGNLGQRRLPTNAKLTVTVDGREFAATVQGAGTMNELAAALKKELEAANYSVDLAPGSIYVKAPRRTPAPKIAVHSSSPLLQATVVGGKFHPGRPQPTTATWEMVGAASANDTFAWEWSDAAGRGGKASWKATSALGSSELAEKLIEEFRTASPPGARWSTMTGRTAQGEVGAVLRCEIDAAHSSPGLRGRVSLKATNPTAWKRPPRSDWQRFADAGGLGDDLAWIRFGSGPMQATAKGLSLPLDKDLDGLHYLRIAVTTGNETLAAAVAELPFVKRTSDKRLRLRALKAKTTLAAGPTAVAEAYSEGGLSFVKVEYRVDERSVAEPAERLTIDPRVYGVGNHRVRARLRTAAGIEREADDAVEFTVEP